MKAWVIYALHILQHLQSLAADAQQRSVIFRWGGQFGLLCFPLSHKAQKYM